MSPPPDLGHHCTAPSSIIILWKMPHSVLEGEKIIKHLEHLEKRYIVNLFSQLPQEHPFLCSSSSPAETAALSSPRRSVQRRC